MKTLKDIQSTVNEPLKDHFVLDSDGLRKWLVNPYFLTIVLYTSPNGADGNWYRSTREMRYGLTYGERVDRTNEDKFWNAVKRHLKKQNS